MERKKNKQAKLNVRKGDTVKVIAGDSKGAQGRVLEVLVSERRVLVEGVNMVTKHTKPNAKNTQGGIVKQEAPIHISNVMLVSGEGTTRIGFKRDKVTKRRPDGSTYEAERSVRIARKTGDEI